MENLRLKMMRKVLRPAQVFPFPSLFLVFFLLRSFVFNACCVIFICDCPWLRAQWPRDPRPQAPQGETHGSLAYSPQKPGDEEEIILLEIASVVRGSKQIWPLS